MKLRGTPRTCLRSAVTPLERRMGATTRASALILLGDVHGGFVDLLEAIDLASETGDMGRWSPSGPFCRHRLCVSRQDSEGIRLLENAITTYDARGEDPDCYLRSIEFSLAEIYLEMLTSRARPPISAILRMLA